MQHGAGPDLWPTLQLLLLPTYRCGPDLLHSEWPDLWPAIRLLLLPTYRCSQNLLQHGTGPDLWPALQLLLLPTNRCGQHLRHRPPRHPGGRCGGRGVRAGWWAGGDIYCGMNTDIVVFRAA